MVKAKDTVSIQYLINETKSDFKELGAILDNVAQQTLHAKGLVFENHYELKQSLSSNINLKPADKDQIKQDWKLIADRNIKSCKCNFVFEKEQPKA